MVGVPGRSKGCNTCRKRKKGCDLQRPSCGQCIATGRACEGYGREINFVAYRDKADSPTYDRTQTDPEYVQHSDRRAKKNVSKSGEQTSLPTTRHGTNQKALEQQLASRFYRSHLPDENDIAGPFQELTTSQSWYTLARIIPEDPVLRLSTLALSFAKLSGIYPEDPILRQNSLSYYGKTLLEMKSALSNKTRRLSDDVLDACGLMLIYEIMQGATITNECKTAVLGNSWMSHANGITVLMQVRGPLMHTEGTGFRLFRNMRFNGITSAISSRKSSFWNHPTWKVLPFTKHRKGLIDLIVDILGELPQLLEQVDDALAARGRQQSTKDIMQLRYLLSECWRLDKALQQWIADLQAYIARVSPDLRHPEALLESPETFDTTSYGLAHCTSLYWAACVILYSTLYQCHNDLTALDTACSAPVLPPRAAPGQYARNIKEVIPVFFRPSLRSMGPTNISFALGMAWQYFQALGPYGQLELDDMLYKLNQIPAGRMIARFLGGMRQATQVKDIIYPIHVHDDGRQPVWQHHYPRAGSCWNGLQNPVAPATPESLDPK